MSKIFRTVVVACCATLAQGAVMEVVPGEGWENVDPGRRAMLPGKVLWKADLSRGVDAFELERNDGAEGCVTVEGGKLRIVKSNDVGYLVLRPKEPFAVPPGTQLQAFAYVEGERNDPEYAMGFLRMYGKHKTYDYFSALDGRRRGGPKMDYLFNTPPGVRERKLCRFKADAAVTPVIVVAGPRSDSTWSDWGVEDLKEANVRWAAFIKKVEPPDHSGDRQGEAEFDAALRADTDHTAKVVRRGDAPVLLVDGVETPPVFFKGKIQRDSAKNLYCGRRMEENGVRMQVVTVRFGDSPKMHGWWSKKGFDVQGAVREVKDAMRMAPKSLFVLTAILDAYPEFTAEHPDETWIADGGCTVWGNQTHADYDLDPKKKRNGYWPWVSYSSVVWREAVRTNLVALIDALKASGLAKRIVGIHLGAFHDHQFATRRLDFSRPAVEGFRRWQERTFGKVRWDGAPEFDPKLDFFTPGRDDHQIAYFRYLKRQPFELQEDLVRTAKARFGKDVIGVRWCMAAFGGMYGGAYDITPFAKSDAIDVIAPQADYSRRTPGAAIGQRMPVASFREHGKLMFCEFDFRTYGAVSGRESELCVTGDSQATDDAMWRSTYRKCAGQQIASRMGWWFYDMAGGWFEPQQIAADIADSVRTVRRLSAAPQRSVATTAIVVDEDGALLRNLPSHWYNHDEERVFATQLQLLAGCGVPTDFWLADDLIRNPSLAKRYRTLVFGGMYNIDAARRRLLDSLKGDGRTLVFLSGTGVSGGGEATGFEIVHERAPRSHRVVAEPGVDVNMVSFTDHLVWTKFLGGGKLGNHWRPRRDTVKETPGVKVMARFSEDGEPAVAERAFGAGKDAWKSVMICSAAGLTPQYLNALVRGSGGYAPAPYGLQVDMNSSFLSVHAIIPGRYDFRLPRPCRVTNLKTWRAVDAPGGVFAMDLTAGETRWYGLGLKQTDASGSAPVPPDVMNLMDAPVIMRGSSFKGSSNFDTSYMDTTNHYDAIADGNTRTWWEPMEERGPHFIEMRWNHAVCACGAQWKFANIGVATLSRWRKGGWERVATLSGDGGTLDFPVSSSGRWKLDVVKAQGTPKVFELRLTGPRQYILPAEIPNGSDTGCVTVTDFKLPEGPFRPGDDVDVGFKVSAMPETVPFGLMVELSDRAALRYQRREGCDFCSGRWAVRPDADGKVSLRIELPPWTPHGSNDIIVTALSDRSGRQLTIKNRVLGPIVVERPGMPGMLEPVRTVGLGANATGQRGFVINGKWHPAFFNRLFGNPTPEHLAATAGTGPSILFWQNRDRMPIDEAAMQARIDWFDQRIRMALRICPQNYFILSQNIKPDSKWIEKHPDELMRLEDGTIHPEKLFSFGSGYYMRKSEEYISRLVSFISRQPYGDRVIGYHLWTCTKNDGFVGGAMINSRIPDRKDYLLGDYHPGAIALFREFLRKKYGGDVARLRRAWRNDSVGFDDALVGRFELVREDFPRSVFRDPVRSRPAIDYLEFIPSLIGRYNRRVTAAIKRESKGRALTMVHSGAVLASMRMSWGRQLQSNNNDLAELLDDPNIDMFVQAQPYNTRWAGDAMHVYNPEKSIALHGKLYLFDHDHRTLGCGFLRDGRHRSQYESEAVFRRDYAHQWIENAGAWIADMSYSRWPHFDSECLPWYDMPEVARPIRETLAAMQTLDAPRRSASEIAVVLSLNSPRYEDACRAGPIYKGLINDFLLQKGLPFLGAPYDVILTSDLGHPDLPDYRLYMFLNPTYFTDAERLQIDRLKRGGKVLAWFYAPGYSTDGGLSLDAASETCGIRLKIKEGAFETPALTFCAGNPLSDGLADRTLSAVTWDVFEKGDLSPARISPVFFADDPDVAPAGLYADGRVAYGVKDFGGWKSVWCGVPNFDLPALVRLARFAGVHLYADAPVVLNADNRMMMIHNGYGATRTVHISLPREAKVSELFSGETIADGKEFDVSLAAPDTKLLKLEYCW